MFLSEKTTENHYKSHSLGEGYNYGQYDPRYRGYYDPGTVGTRQLGSVQVGSIYPHASFSVTADKTSKTLLNRFTFFKIFLQTFDNASLLGASTLRSFRFSRLLWRRAACGGHGAGMSPCSSHKPQAQQHRGATLARPPAPAGSISINFRRSMTGCATSMSIPMPYSIKPVGAASHNYTQRVS